MSVRPYAPLRELPGGRPPRAEIVPNGVLGMLVFVCAEAMLFAGFVSAFTIMRAQALVWPPPGQPRLPVGETAFNTLLLLGSGVALWLARRAYRRDQRAVQGPLLAALVLGTAFVALQGREWLGLLEQGLTLQSSALGSFFYLIVGVHGLHAIGALALLFHAWRRLRSGWLPPGVFGAAEVFWYFVVGVWPLLYWRVYL